MSINIGVAVLAAGKGTRLNLNCAKPLAPVLGQTLIDFSIEALNDFFNKTKLTGEITAVIGHDRESVKKHLESKFNDIKFSVQEQQIGTADALRAYFEGNPNAKNYEYTLVMCSDTPMIRATELCELFNSLSKNNLNAVAATFNAAIPQGYGRIIRSNNNGFHIVEEKDATDEIRKVCEVNSGLYVMKTSFILEHLYSIGSENLSGEFYLTDLFKDEFDVAPVLFPKEETFIGVNNLEQLETVTTLIKNEKNKSLRESGVRFIDSSTCYIDWNVEIGKGTLIYPNVVIEGATVIGADCKISLGSMITDSTLENNVEVKAYTIFEDAIVKAAAVIGPFARLRPGSDIGPESKIGNFVELKKSKLSKGVKVSHLSYVGDAEIGDETNIGCGFITCNYDGANKHKTVIGKNSFIGSDSQMVAPITIGNNCFVASGSTITQSMEDGDFAVCRGRQTTKKGLAKRFLKTKK